jgi:hypothetical protein
MLKEMSSPELTDWMAFDRISPIGDERMDLRFAVLNAQIAGMFHDPKNGPSPKPADFMLFKPPMSAEQKAAIVQNNMQILRERQQLRDP